MLEQWARAAGPRALVQISHPGRQTTRFVQPCPVSPSGGPAVDLAGLFARPRALVEEEIVEIRTRFITAARIVVEAGFAGVEVHAAHGYLLSSFLDPSQNLRTDQSGGDIEGRSRLLVEIVSELKRVLPERAAVAVKLDALWSSPPRSPRWSSPPWFPRWSSVRLDCAPPWSYRLRGLPMAVLFVEGCRRGCATSASASAVSSRLLLSGREQGRDNELSWVSASQPGSRWTHRIF